MHAIPVFGTIAALQSRFTMRILHCSIKVLSSPSLPRPVTLHSRATARWPQIQIWRGFAHDEQISRRVFLESLNNVRQRVVRQILFVYFGRRNHLSVTPNNFIPH
jgi:hypothetical protein